MPELPEVETVRRGLAGAIQGQQICAARIDKPEILRTQDESEFRQRVIGATFGTVNRRGKYLLIELHSPNPTTLCIHLKMRGQLRLLPAMEMPVRYECLRLEWHNGDALVYSDAWRWGEVRALTDGEMATLLPLSTMGREPFDETWTTAVFWDALQKRSGNLKSALLDQGLVAGIGNIYADEALFESGIRPDRSCKTLTEIETVRLHNAIGNVLRNAANAGGTQSDEFVDIYERQGNYNPKAYNRGKQNCLNCGQMMVRTKIGGRGTTYCANCQK